MKYVFDHDLHIHSELSSCSGNPEQTPEAILAYAETEHLNTICLTDHYWDRNVPGVSDWYRPQDFNHIAKALPLPKKDGIRFLFGCETDLDKSCTLGIPPERYDDFDFIIIPTTHLHMAGFTCRGDEGPEERARLWVERFDRVLDMELPFHKVGIAHLTCSLMYQRDPAAVLNGVPDSEMHRVFARAARCGVGIELNFPASALGVKYEPEAILRPYRIAKEEGCKFYFGSDAHGPSALAAERANAERIIELLGLEESDKFILK